MQLSEYSYRVSGAIELCNTVTKSVVVDGDEYFKKEEITYLFSLDEEWEINRNNFTKIEIDEFNILGKDTIIVYDYKLLNNYASRYATSLEYSQNHKTQLVYTLANKFADIFPKKIIRNGEKIHLRPPFNKIYLSLYGYGYNNSFGVYLSYQEIIKLDIPNPLFIDQIDVQFRDMYFPKNWTVFNEIEKTNMLVNYISSSY